MDGETLDYYCPMCWEREAPGGQCGCGLTWNANRRDYPHYAVLRHWKDAEKAREKHARNKKRTAYVFEHQGDWILVEVTAPGSKNGPIGLTRRLSTRKEALETAETLGITVLWQKEDGSRLETIPGLLKRFVVLE